MIKYFSFLLVLFIQFSSCKNSTKEEKLTASSDSIIEPAIPVNANFPFGAKELSGNVNSFFFPPSSENYGHTLPVNGQSIDSISYYFGKINGSATIDKPSIRKIEFVKLEEHSSDFYFDTLASRGMDSCKFRLPNIGIYECYYFVNQSKGDTYGIYGNLLLRDTLMKNGKLINIYYEYGGDQNVSLKYFYFSKNQINIYKGSAYDDGTTLGKKFQIDISDDGAIDIKQAVALTDIKYKLYINYEKKISAGNDLYSSIFIYPEASEYRIESKKKSRTITIKNIPYSPSDILAKRNSIRSDSILQKMNQSFLNGKSENYTSIRTEIKVAGKDYIVYKHFDMNCYDPLCGSKHNHMTTQIGYTYFSPEFGVLFNSVDQMQFEILASIGGLEIPQDLILELLKKEAVDEKIVNKYVADIKMDQN